jgi:hypothetical protein
MRNNITGQTGNISWTPSCTIAAQNLRHPLALVELAGDCTA